MTESSAHSSKKWVLTDRNREFARGQVLDLAHGQPFFHAWKSKRNKIVQTVRDSAYPIFMPPLQG